MKFASFKIMYSIFIAKLINYFESSQQTMAALLSTKILEGDIYLCLYIYLKTGKHSMEIIFAFYLTRENTNFPTQRENYTEKKVGIILYEIYIIFGPGKSTRSFAKTFE